MFRGSLAVSFWGRYTLPETETAFESVIESALSGIPSLSESTSASVKVALPAYERLTSLPC